MFTRNWYNLLKMCCYGSGNGGLTAINTSGESFNICNDGVSYASSGTPSWGLPSPISCFPQCRHDTQYISLVIGGYRNTGAFVHIGSGVTAANIDDYCLESPHTENLSVINSTGSRVIQDNTVTVEYKYTIQNTGDNDVLVSEIGIVTPVMYGTSYYEQHPVLIDRTVLAEPINIPANGMEVVTYTIVYTLPNPD